MSLIVDCIWSEHRRDYVHYLKSIKSNYNIVIDYYAISNKLAKLCPYKQKPKQSVIGLHIFKILESALSFHSDQKILYLFKNLEPVTISNLKETIADFYCQDFEFNLHIISDKKIENASILSLFDNVIYLEYDKT